MVELEIRCLAGTNIEEACGEASRLARMLSINITFDFNGIKVFIRPSSLPEVGVEAYRKALQGKQDLAIV